MNEIGIYCPSWKRGRTAFTHEHLSQARYVVAESQRDEYDGKPIWVAPDSAQGNLCRIRNWILDNAPEPWILLLDDDFSGLVRWDGNRKVDLSEEQTMEHIEHGFTLAEEWGCVFWGVNCIPDKGAYREYTPFSLTNYIGGPWQAFIGPPEVRYDEALPLKEDYDLTLQVMNRWRKALRINFLYYKVKQHTNTGGCADYRTMEREVEQFEALRRKWGSQIVRMDGGESRVNRKKGATWDLNPIIRVPIKGV